MATLPDEIRRFPAMVQWIADTYHPNQKHPSRDGAGSMYALANKIGCAPALAYRYASGNVRMPMPHHMKAISEIYGIPFLRVLECVLSSFTGMDLYVRERGKRARGRKAAKAIGVLLLGGATVAGSLDTLPASAATSTAPESVTRHYVNSRRGAHRLGRRSSRWSTTCWEWLRWLFVPFPRVPSFACGAA